MSRLRALTDGEAGVTLVEMLVVMVLLGVVGAATTGVVLSTQRSEQFQDRLREVMDDGRVALERVRAEIRQARRVYPTSCRPSPDPCYPTGALHFWIDENQDAIVQDEEEICYLVEPLSPSSTNQWRLVRWDNADGSCDAGSRPSSGVSVIAQTLVDERPFVLLDPVPSSDATDPYTRDVTVHLELEVPGERGPGVTDFETTVRLRNVA